MKSASAPLMFPRLNWPRARRSYEALRSFSSSALRSEARALLRGSMTVDSSRMAPVKSRLSSLSRALLNEARIAFSPAVRSSSCCAGAGVSAAASASARAAAHDTNASAPRRRLI